MTGLSVLTAEITRTGLMVGFGDVVVCEDLSDLRIDFPGVIVRRHGCGRWNRNFRLSDWDPKQMNIRRELTKKRIVICILPL